MDKKIIWIDDDKKTLEKAEPIFNENGFVIIKCYSIAHALKEVMLGSSNNLLLDVDFPNSHKEGLVFLEQLKSIAPDLKVVVFTGFPEFNDAVIAVRDMMASDYISKPIPIDDDKRDLFFKQLHKAFNTEKVEEHNTINIQKIKTSLESCDIKTFIAILRSIFAKLSYNMKTQESYFQGYIQIILDLMGMKIDSEVETNLGRIDAVIETKKYLYLMEFKLNDSAAAIRQIKDKKYFQKYVSHNKEIIFVGISFDKVERNIKNYKYKKYKE